MEAAAHSVEHALDAYKEDLWLKRRLKLDEVIAKLTGLLPSSATDAGSSGSGNGCIGSVQELIKFIQFLQSECSGELLSDDKQWGQLMNLMQISRKLNHKSVKFKDIIENRQLIEANASEIRRFNEQARLCRSIEKLIDTFELNLDRAHLLLSPAKATTIRQVDADRQEGQQDLADISRCRRNLDITLRSAVRNLQVYLQNLELISTLFSAQRENWSKKLDLFTRISNKLCNFVENYLAFKKELVHLRPLVESLSSSDADKSAITGSIAHKNDLIENSLASCKADFKQVLEFERDLEAQLLMAAQSSRKLESNRTPSAAITARSVGRSSAHSSNRKDHQVEVKLLKLLRPNKLDEFTSDMYAIKLDEALTLVRECRHTLDRMMANLRLEFGRFYFVNDLELLTIISLDSRLAADCDRVENQRLISKLFNNSIERFLLSHQINGSQKSKSQPNAKDLPLYIAGVQNPAGEQILLTEPIRLHKRVNIYSLEIIRILNELLRKLQRSLASTLAISLGQSQFHSGQDWSLPVQLLDLAERIKFTRRVESALENGSTNERLNAMLAEYEIQLRELSGGDSVIGDSSSKYASERSELIINDFKKSAALSLTVHFISTILSLARMKVCSATDWNWLKLARYYWRTDYNSSEQSMGELESANSTRGQVDVCLASSRFRYKFDLLPLESVQASSPSIKRLIYTETSERCFLVASQATGRLKLGASPFGPAGSGKTETIKALGQLLGCQVIVHNCDETNDAQALERLIWGLTHTGLWGCFDEFNRLSSGTLSSVSALLEFVQMGLRSNRTTMELADGRMKRIDPDSAFFITMNPSDGQKYQGRRRLPANLRSLFLPIAMVRVQIDSIVRETLLVYSATITTKQNTVDKRIDANLAERIGLQMGVWVEWMRANVCIDRCEWDLRLVMTVLRRFKAAMLVASGNSETDTSLAANRVLIESIMKEVMPRLDDTEFELLRESFRQAFDVNSSLAAQISQMTKADSILQELEQQLETRVGVIILGPSRSGKSCLWRSLAARKNQVNKGEEPVITLLQLFPMSCSKNELFGHFKASDDQAESSSSNSGGGGGSSRWKDGLFTRLVRNSIDQLQRSACTQQVWLVLDGPLDPDWIESLNSVLDDNQVLTLSSGERLNFVLLSQDHRHNQQQQQQHKCIKLIFETDNMSNASPATISRLGLINLVSSRRDALPLNDDTGDDEQMVELMVCLVRDNASLQPRALRNWILKHLTNEFNLNRGDMNVFEFSCFEGVTSELLLELLQLVSSINEKQTILLINNLHLIGSEDRWQTSTFTELLRHVVNNGSYYDSEHKLQLISSKMRIILTTVENPSASGHFNRLLALARAHLTISGKDLSSDELQVGSNQEQKCSISLDQLINWCRFGTSKDDDNEFVALLVKVYERGRARELLKSLVDKLRCLLDDGIELYEFNNSTNVLKSVEMLSRLANQKTGQSFSMVNTNKKRQPLFLMDSLQLSLIDPKLRSRMCHLFSLIRLKNIHLESSSLRCLLLFDAKLQDSDEMDDTAATINDSNYIFWLQMAAAADDKRNLSTRNGLLKYEEQFVRIGSNKGDPTELKNFLHPILDWDSARSSIDWLSTALEAYFDGSNQRNLERRAFLRIFVKMTSGCKRHVESQQRMLKNGLRRLADFETAVESVGGRRQADEVSLAKRRAEIESLLEHISNVIESGQRRNEQLEELRQRQGEKTAELRRNKKRIEMELASVLPLIEASKREVDQCLKPEALNEIKTLRAPPKTIKDILDVLFVLLLGQADTVSWQEMKSYLTRYSLRDELTNKFDFQKRLANERLLARLEREIQAKQDSFQLDQAARASSAIVPIVKWIQAAREYGRVLTTVRPLTESMQALERESNQLIRAMEELELEQSKLNEKILVNQKELADLETSYKLAKQQLDEAKLGVERAQSIRSNLSTPIERWQSKLVHYNELADDDRELFLVCLICTSMTVNVHDLASLSAEIDLWHKIAGKNREVAASGGANSGPACSPTSVYRLIADYVSIVLESAQVDERFVMQIGSCIAQSEQDTAYTKRMDHLVKLLVCRLNICFNSDQLLHLWVEPTQSIDGLVRYLSHGQILCTQHEDLVLIRPGLSSGDCFQQQDARLALEASLRKILLIELPTARAGNSTHTLLDVLDLFLCESANVIDKPGRVVLFSRKCDSRAGAQFQHLGTQFGKETRHFLRMLDVISARQSCSASDDYNDDDDDDDELNRLEADITDHLVEFHEPELGATICRLELELRSQQAEVSQLEANLLKSLTKSGDGINATPDDGNDALNSKNELVRLLLELNQSSESLTIRIKEISAKLNDLQTKRERFQANSRQAAQFYRKHLARLKFIDRFYHLSPKGFVRSFASQAAMAPNGGEGGCSIAATVEHVMCSMRPHHRQAFKQSILAITTSPKGDYDAIAPLDRQTLRLASQRAANLKQTILRLIVDMSKTNDNSSEQQTSKTGLLLDHSRKQKQPRSLKSTSVAFKLAIILHDARKSSPQMEVDELFVRQQQEIFKSTAAIVEYHKLYATTMITNGNDNNNCSLVETAQCTSVALNESASNQLESQLNRILSRESSASLGAPSSGNGRATSATITTTAVDLTREVSSEKGGGDLKATNTAAAGDKQLIKCICIANAHLAAHWINTRLLDVITRGRRTLAAVNGGDAKLEPPASHQLLVLLVAECDESAPKSVVSSLLLSGAGQEKMGATFERSRQEQSPDDLGFDLNLLEEAHLRFWYDELGLALVYRFQLYKQMILPSSSNDGKLVQRSDHNEQLTKQLILFHVVCQELSIGERLIGTVKKDITTTTKGWQMAQNYNFDYELLCLALKVLRQITKESALNCLLDAKPNAIQTIMNQPKYLRDAFCHHLESIIYGARMETQEDEGLLTRLIDTFLRSAESSQRRLAEFERLIKLTQNGGEQRELQHHQLLARLLEA